MLQTSSFLLAIAAMFAISLTGCAVTSSDGARSNEAVVERETWHTQRLTTLRAEDGWLTLVGLDFLESGEFSFGSEATCALRYQHATAPKVGTFVVTESDVRFQTSRSDVTVDGSPIEREATLVADDRGTPSVLRNGPLTITVVRRNGVLALRVKDNRSVVRTEFQGIDLFEFDRALVVRAEVVPTNAGETVAITNVTGFVEEQPVAARLRFSLAGATHEFVATAGSNGRLFVVFGDATNGRESYGGGRFLDIPAPTDGQTTIDFNRATNPPCAFTAFATCPMPPATNRLPVAVRGGERKPKSSA